ncbi:hypothetical protein AFK62_14020 [Cronobacter condimenti 1330]|uniref:Uncharacterized protein n=2 Tax=Cronobacter condimenti 1330 TaxID=1073999 RepID=A0ABM5VET1_9ENTR|nr:hypothetical protein [Cronobacter condimenti]ALB63548.1 hypothetical protein AFK62_14020 [Cronobacter condimenti 1330]
MSARERFFRKIQQNKQPAPAGDNPVAVDIARFCRQMDELAQQICQWLDGSGIDVINGTKHLSDLSTVGACLNSGASRYDIRTISIQHDNKSVSIAPAQLYASGRKGCITLTIDSPDLKHARQYFYLHMTTEDGWLIDDNAQPELNGVLLTEEVFFKIIERLA